MRLYKSPLILTLLLCFSACNKPVSPSDSQTQEQPLLVVYTSHREEIYAPIVKEFEERHGVWVQVHTGGSHTLLDQLLEERAAPRCDVLFGGYALSHRAYAACLEPYSSEAESAIDPAYQPEDHLYTPFSLLAPVIVYHTKLVKPADVPARWQCLLDARWEGRIAFADPRNSASCFVALTALLQAVPGNWAENLETFTGNLGPVFSGSDAVIPAVDDGLFPLGIALEEEALRQVRSGSDIGVVYPEEGVAVMPDAVSLVRDAPHPDLGKDFIDFVVSRDIQQMLAADLGRRPARLDIAHPGWVQPLSDIPLLDYDSEWTAGYRATLLEEWDRLVPAREAAP